MAVPAMRLRQPKCIQNAPKPSSKSLLTEAHLILTLKNEKKLVVSSDAYHGIVKYTDTYECVICDETMELDVKLKEIHKGSQKHKSALNGTPFCEEFSLDLVRQITENQAFCTTCNSVVGVSSLSRHVSSEPHVWELSKALERSHIYKPSE